MTTRLTYNGALEQVDVGDARNIRRGDTADIDDWRVERLLATGEWELADGESAPDPDTVELPEPPARTGG